MMLEKGLYSNRLYNKGQGPIFAAEDGPGGAEEIRSIWYDS